MKLGCKTCTEAKDLKPEHKPKQVKQLYSLTMHSDSESGDLVALATNPMFQVFIIQTGVSKQGPLTYSDSVSECLDYFTLNQRDESFFKKNG